MDAGRLRRYDARQLLLTGYGAVLSYLSDGELMGGLLDTDPMSPEALAIQDGLGLRYASDVRGTAPFRPAVNGAGLRTIQVPTTLPTLDELLGRVRDLPGALLAALRPGLNVFTLHAEVEGGPLLPTFAEFLEGARRRGAVLATLEEAVAGVLGKGDHVPVAPVTRARVDGRSGWVASQGLGCVHA